MSGIIDTYFKVFRKHSLNPFSSGSRNFRWNLLAPTGEGEGGRGEGISPRLVERTNEWSDGISIRRKFHKRNEYREWVKGSRGSERSLCE